MEQVKRFPSISIALPASLTADTPHLREKTFKIGFISRALAIFRVDEIIIFRDLKKKKLRMDMELLASILSYVETPQYLRKNLFPIKQTLKYVGILPPLRTPHHPTSRYIKRLSLNEHREGIVVKTDEEKSYVDIGVERPVLLYEPNLSIGKRITVKVSNLQINSPEVTIARSEEINIYWGYHVTLSNATLGQIIKENYFDLKIMTSRHGKPLNKIICELKERWKKASKVLIAFGSPKEGLTKILANEGLDMDMISDFNINVIPQQGTKTIRTEEALYATLTAINLI
jgi:predicted SPOUT superfamily RNA methylase MTH1